MNVNKFITITPEISTSRANKGWRYNRISIAILSWPCHPNRNATVPVAKKDGRQAGHFCPACRPADKNVCATENIVGGRPCPPKSNVGASRHRAQGPTTYFNNVIRLVITFPPAVNL